MAKEKADNTKKAEFSKIPARDAANLAKIISIR